MHCTHFKSLHRTVLSHKSLNPALLHRMQISVVYLFKKNQHSSFWHRRLSLFLVAKVSSSFVQNLQDRQHMLKSCSSIPGDLISVVVSTGKQEAYAFAV